MRLIDADALADALLYKHKIYPQWVADVIGNMPDAIVLCKDCKHHHEHNCEIWNDGVYNPDWFCADGERRNTDG